MNHEAVCRTAPATPGLSIMKRLFMEQPLVLPGSANNVMGFSKVQAILLVLKPVLHYESDSPRFG